jgi:hypothetical protein
MDKRDSISGEVRSEHTMGEHQAEQTAVYDFANGQSEETTEVKVILPSSVAIWLASYVRFRNALRKPITQSGALLTALLAGLDGKTKLAAKMFLAEQQNKQSAEISRLNTLAIKGVFPATKLPRFIQKATEKTVGSALALEAALITRSSLTKDVSVSHSISLDLSEYDLEG